MRGGALAVLSVLLCLLVAGGYGQDPYRLGSYREQGMVRELRPDGAKGEILSIVFPLTAGNFPVHFFVGGLQGLTSFLGYKSVVEHVVSHGIILVGMSTMPDGPDDHANAAKMVHAIDWLFANLNSTLEAQVPGLSADLDRTTLMGHSAGCKVLTRFLKNGCSVSKINPLAAVLIDPVDGSDPWGFIKEFVIEDGEKLLFSIPTLMIGTGLGPIPGTNRTIGPLPWPACAPEGVNYPRFYDAYQCNKWLHVTENFGHADMMDQIVVIGLSLINMCSTNEEASLLDFNAYRTYVGGATVALIRGTSFQEQGMFRYIEDDALIPRANMIGVKIQFDTSCSGGAPKPGCFD